MAHMDVWFDPVVHMFEGIWEVHLDTLQISTRRQFHANLACLLSALRDPQAADYRLGKKV